MLGHWLLPDALLPPLFWPPSSRVRICLTHLTNTQIYKDTNTKIHKDTNTQIHKDTNSQIRPVIPDQLFHAVGGRHCFHCWGLSHLHINSKHLLRFSGALASRILNVASGIGPQGQVRFWDSDILSLLPHYLCYPECQNLFVLINKDDFTQLSTFHKLLSKYSSSSGGNSLMTGE